MPCVVVCQSRITTHDYIKLAQGRDLRLESGHLCLGFIKGHICPMHVNKLRVSCTGISSVYVNRYIRNDWLVYGLKLRGLAGRRWKWPNEWMQNIFNPAIGVLIHLWSGCWDQTLLTMGFINRNSRTPLTNNDLVSAHHSSRRHAPCK